MQNLQYIHDSEYFTIFYKLALLRNFDTEETFFAFASATITHTYQSAFLLFYSLAKHFILTARSLANLTGLILYCSLRVFFQIYTWLYSPSSCSWPSMKPQSGKTRLIPSRSPSPLGAMWSMTSSSSKHQPVQSTFTPFKGVLLKQRNGNRPLKQIFAYIRW